MKSRKFYPSDYHQLPMSAGDLQMKMQDLMLVLLANLTPSPEQDPMRHLTVNLFLTQQGYPTLEEVRSRWNDPDEFKRLGLSKKGLLLISEAQTRIDNDLALPHDKPHK